MWNRHSSKERPTRRISHRWVMLVLAGSLIPALGRAEAPSVPTILTLKSGFHSVLARHTLVLTVTDVGLPKSTSRVMVEFLDRTGRRRAFTSTTVSPERPLSVKVNLPAGTVLDMLRVIVTLEVGAGSQPIAGLEDIDADSFRLDTKPPCAPPSVGGTVQGNCDGWVVNRLAVDQAPHWPN